MATPAKTLAATCATRKYDALSTRGVAECQLACAAHTVTGTDAQTLTTAASVNNDPALSTNDIAECLTAAIQ